MAQQTKEAIYDEQIAPLMKQIIKICQENSIALVSTFGLDDIGADGDKLLCSTALIGGKYGTFSKLVHAAFILGLTPPEALQPVQDAPDLKPM